MKTVVYGLFALGLIAAAGLWLANTSDELGAGPVELPDGIYDPVRSGEPTPTDFRQLLRRDAIHPVYNPTFRTAETTEWPGEALVIDREILDSLPGFTSQEADARTFWPNAKYWGQLN